VLRVSRFGILLLLSERLFTGSCVNLRLQPPGGDPIIYPGRILFSEPDPDQGGYLTRIRFPVPLPETMLTMVAAIDHAG